MTAVYIPKVHYASSGQNQDHGVHNNTIPEWFDIALVKNFIYS